MKIKEKYTKKNILSIIKERIKDNKNLFTQQEYDNINKNIDTYIKVYFLAILDDNI